MAAHHPLRRPLRHLLVANRGEIALRLVQAAADAGLHSTAVWADEDAGAPHTGAATQGRALGAAGPAAYLDLARLLAVARETGCDAVHPGYGFLAERADAAQAFLDAGLAWVGPPPGQLALLGDKAQARALAQAQGVPVLPGTAGPVTLAGAEAFMAGQGGAPVMLKAVGGGGGRGLRVVRQADELPAAYARCAREAEAAFGHGAVYAERWLAQARHVEVQVAGDGQHVVSLGERECTLQRQHQKLVEVAPSPRLAPALRQALELAALRLAAAIGLHSLATFEFLLGPGDGEAPWFFIEANPRLQVEHTVTEAVTGLDLVRLQLDLAAGARLADLGLASPPAPRGSAVQWRLNAEILDREGRARPASGVLQGFALPQGAGLRVDTALATGRPATPQFDTLMAKLVVHGSQGWPELLRRSQRALAACRVDGIATNLGLLQALAARPELEAWAVDTGFVAREAAALGGGGDGAPPDAPAVDALALLAPMAGRLVAHEQPAGAVVAAQAPLAVIEAMKMEHLLHATAACRVRAWCVQPGASVAAGERLAELEPVDPAQAGTALPGLAEGAAAADTPRADLQRVLDRWARVHDAARPEAVAARHARGGRTARENVAATCDAGSFVEYGAFAVAAQSRRRSAEELLAQTPADGMVTGIGSVHAAERGEDAARTVVMAYDATVLAGTQGARNHAKTDRLLRLAHEQRLPVVLWAEGGGGRPGDVDMPVVAGLHVGTFAAMAQLSGRVPLVGIAAGRCFAGNAALLGCCDVILATRDATLGMGGPAMIEGGGLGRYAPEQVGPAPLLADKGVVDRLVADEAEAAALARRLVALLGHGGRPWPAVQEPDAARLRQAVPENRLRVYDMRALLGHLFDVGSALELRAGFGRALITQLARLGGRAVGVLASDPAHGGGAIDADAADKGARFLQLCQAHGLPVITLVDTPGFMVGPEAEARGQIRHACRLFLAGAALRVPVLTVVLRKAYGLGAMALAAGSLHAPACTVAWPTAEFGAMGLEGAVRLGWRKELAAAPEGSEREALFQQLLAAQVEAGGAVPLAATLEIDAVIDPADTRQWLLRGLQSTRVRPDDGAARFVDSW